MLQVREPKNMESGKKERESDGLEEEETENDSKHNYLDIIYNFIFYSLI
jgi:hypothetical protein